MRTKNMYTDAKKYIAINYNSIMNVMLYIANVKL